MDTWVSPTIIIAVLSQFGTMIWWMAKASTTLSAIKDELHRIVRDIERREDKRDTEIRGIHERINEIKAS